MKNENYEIVTREELLKHIKGNNLEVKYYHCTWEDDIDDAYKKLSLWLFSSPAIIPESKVYFDIEQINGRQPHLEKMTNDIKYRDVIITRNLHDDFSLSYPGILFILSAIVNHSAELYLINYDDSNYIKINVKSLMIHILSLQDSVSYGANFELSEISDRYYDGKLH